MKENESSKWLYNELVSNGYNVGKDYEEFDSLMTNNEESRKWAYDTARELGYNVGKDYEEFNTLVNPVVSGQPISIEPKNSTYSPYSFAPTDYTQKTEAQKNYEERGDFEPKGQGTVNLNGQEVPVFIGDEGQFRVPSPVKLDEQQEIFRHGNPSEAEQREEQERSYRNFVQSNRAKMDETDKRLSERMGEMTKQYFNDYKGVLQSDAMGEPAYMTALKGNRDYQNLRAAHNLIEDARKREKQVRRADEGFLTNTFRSMGETAIDERTWDLGARDMTDAISIYNAVQKDEKGEELTDSERILLDAFEGNALVMAQNKYRGESGGELAGAMTVEMIPFIAQIVANPLAKLGEATSKGAAKAISNWLYKRTKDMANKTARKAVRSAARGAVKFGAGLPADLAGGMGVAVTSNVMNTTADVYDRMLKGDSAGEAIAKGITSQGIEFASENAGRFFEPFFGGLGKVLGKGAEYGLNKVGAGSVVNLAKDYAKKAYTPAVKEFMDKTQWSGFLGEYGEELVGGVENALLVGDQTVSEVFSKDNLFDTAVGLSVASVLFPAIGTVNYGVEKGRQRKAVKEAEKIASGILKDRWPQFKAAINGAKNSDELGKAIEEIYKKEGKEYSDNKETQALFDYARSYYAYNALKGVDPNNVAYESELISAVRDNYQAGATMTAEELDNTRMDVNRIGVDLMRLTGMTEDELNDMDTAAVTQRINEAEENGDMDIADKWREFMNGSAAMSGKIKAVDDAINEQSAASDAEVDAITDGDGMIVLGTTRGGEQVYIIGGNVVLNGDNSVNKEGSSAQLTVVRDGKRTTMGIVELESVDAPIDAAGEKVSRRTAIEENLRRQQRIDMGEEHVFTPGEKFETLQGEVQFVADRGDGTADITVNGNATVVDMGTLNEQFNTAKQMEYNARKAEETSQAQTVQAEVPQPVNDEQVTSEVAQSALQRVPKDEQGEPIYEQVDSDTAWDAIVEQTEGDEAMAQTVADGMVADKEAALKKLEKAKAKGGATIAEKIAAEKERMAAIEAAKAELAKWKEIAGVAASRKAAPDINEASETETVAEEVKPTESVEVPAVEDVQPTNEMQPAEVKTEHIGESTEMVGTVPSEAENGNENLRPITAPAEVTDVETADEFVAGLLGGIKITPESFRKETGLGTSEQRKLIGVIAGEDKGGVSVERASEIIAENYAEELAASGFNGDGQDIRNMLIDILSSGNPKTYIKQSKERRAAEWVEQETARADAWASENFRFASYDDLIAYEETLIPNMIQKYAGFDEQTYFNTLAENYEYDTTRESERVGSGSEVLQGERSVPSPRTESIGERNQGGAVQYDVQGGAETTDAQEENLGSDLGNASQVEEMNTTISDSTPTLDERIAEYKELLRQLPNREVKNLIKKIQEYLSNLKILLDISQDNNEYNALLEDYLEWQAKLAAVKELLQERDNGGWKTAYGVKLSYNKELSIEDVKTIFEHTNSDKAVAALFDKVYNVAKTLGLKIKVSDQLSVATGNAGNDGMVKYGASLFYRSDIDNQAKAGTLLHELIHTCTMYATTLYRTRGIGGMFTEMYEALPQEIKDACVELNRIYELIKDREEFKGEYGITSVDEMVAELSNVKFRDKMKKVGLWERLVNAIKRLFDFPIKTEGEQRTTDALSEAERVLDTMLENFNKNSYDEIRAKIQSIGKGRKRKIEQRTEFQQINLAPSSDNPAFEAATKNTIDAVKKAGVEVVEATPEMVQAMSELAEMQKRTAPETASVQKEHQPTVVSSADGAKVLKDLDSAIKEYENKSNHPKTLLGDIAKVLGAKKHGSNSQYATFEAVNGRVFTIRLANHNAKVSTFDNHEEDEGISIVVTAQENNGVTNDGEAHVVEFFYDAIKLRKADGKPLVEILKSIKQALYSGEYKDNTGLAQPEEVNIPEFHRVFHGSGAKFDKFDHSHMGEGEGVQVYGWGTYVTEVEGIGRTYATIMRDKAISDKHKENAIINNLARQVLVSNNGDRNAALDELRNLLNESWSDKKRVKAQIKIIETGRFLPESKVKANFYSVEIPDDNGSNYLHWEERINGEIQERIANGLQSIGFEIEPGMNHLAYSRDEKIAVLNINAKGKDLYAELSEALGSDKAASEFLNDMGFVGISYPAQATTGGRKDGARNYVIFNEAYAQIVDHVQFLRTEDGTVYGWAVNGKIYLTPEGMNPNTPAHEYTHLWAAMVEKNNPKLWSRIVEAMKESPTWNEVMLDEAYRDIHNNDSRMASEVLSRLSGEENYRRAMEQAEQEIKAADGIIEKAKKIALWGRIKEALADFWTSVKGVFGFNDKAPWTEFVNMALGDLYAGVNPNAEGSPLERMFIGEKGAANLDKAEEDINFRSGEGAYSDEEVAVGSDPVSKILGKPRFTRKLRREFAERERKRMRKAVDDVASALNTPIEVLETTEGLTGRRATGKGWYEKSTGKIVVVLPNNRSVADVMQTVLHEAVAHYGLRKLFGSGFDNFIDNIYNNVDAETRQKINLLASRNGWNLKVATEEYLASLAEDANFERVNPSLWQRIKSFFLDMLAEAGVRLDIELSDNELRYILWRSYQNLKYPGKYRTIADEARDIAKQGELKVGNYAENVRADVNVAEESDAEYDRATRVAERFNARHKGAAPVVVMKNDKPIEEQLLEIGFSQKEIDFITAKYKKGANAFFNVERNIVVLLRSNLDNKQIKTILWHEAVHKVIREMGITHEQLNNFFELENEEEKVSAKEVLRNAGYEEELFTEEYLAYYIQELYWNGQMNSSDYNVLSRLNDKATENNRKQIEFVQPIINSIVNGTFGFHKQGDETGERRGTEQRSESRNNKFDGGRGTIDRLSLYNSAINEDTGAGIDDDVLFRSDSELAIENYNKRVLESGYQAQEALQDSMLALKEAQEAIVKETGKAMRDEENAYMAENALSSVNTAEAAEYKRAFYQPLVDEVATVGKKMGYEATYDYLMAKHGIERNREMSVKEALKVKGVVDKAKYESWKSERNDTIADAKNNGLSWEETQRKLDALAGNYGATIRDYSGLSSIYGDNFAEKAYSAVKDFENNVDTKALWARIKAANNATLMKLYNSSILDEETFAQISGMYEYYIPLRGFDEKTVEDVYAYVAQDTGRMGSVMKIARGRNSKAENPIAFIGQMAEQAITQGNRNRVKLKFLNFALSHMTSLLTVTRDVYLRREGEDWIVVTPKEAIDKLNNPTPDQIAETVQKWQEDMNEKVKGSPKDFKKVDAREGIPYKMPNKDLLSEHQVFVKRAGKTFVITVNGSPRLAQALNGLTNPDQGTGIKLIDEKANAINRINRMLSNVYTTKNINFVASNFVRDIVYTNSMVWVKESPKYAMKFHKNCLKYNPAYMMRLFSKLENGTLDMSNEDEKLFMEFYKNGGETGYTQIKDIEAKKKELKKMLAKADRKGLSGIKSDPLGKGKDGFDAIGDFLDYVNRSVENVARFAAYKTSREMGRSVSKSIWDAKEISVNFNKKGAGGKFYKANGQTLLGSIAAAVSGTGRGTYVFWNASVQGMYNIAKNAKENPTKALGMAASVFALGVLVSMFAGDDDEYMALPEYIRRNNICFKLPLMDKDSWVTISLPIEYRALYGAGEYLTNICTGKEEFEALKAGELISQLLPIDVLEGGGGLNAFMPTLVKPIWSAYIVNESWTGLPVWKDSPFDTENVPQYKRVYRNTSPALVSFTKMLNQFSGGDEHKTGWIDINPAKLEHVLEGYFGGYATMARQAINLGSGILGDEDYSFDPKDIPVASRVWKYADRERGSSGVKNKFYEYKNNHEVVKAQLKGYAKDAVDPKRTEEDRKYSAERVKEIQKSDAFKAMQVYEAFRKALDNARKMVKEDDTKENRRREAMLMEQVNKEIEKVLNE